MTSRDFSQTSSEVGRTLLQAGLWAATGKIFAIARAGIPQTSPDQFRKALLKRAIREKMMPMLAAFSLSHDLGLGDLPAKLSEVFRIISSEHYKHLRPVVDSLARSGVPVVLIKGADLDLAVYQKMFPRTMGDIDILVQPADVPTVVSAFQREGFVQGKLEKDRFEIVPLSDLERSELEDGSIELAEFTKLVLVPDLLPFRNAIDEGLSYWRMMPLRDAYHLVIGYDVHIHLSLEFDLEDAWSNLRETNFPEVGKCLAQSFTDIAWYLAVRFYHELHLNYAYVMRSFIDVLLVILRNHADIDWDRIVYIADKYKLHPALYYVFWHISELLDGKVPEKVLNSLCPLNAGTQRGHDWGDFVPKMLGDVQLSPIL